MKLKKLHLFLILLAVLILSSLGIGILENFGVIEGNENLMNSKVSLNSVKNRRAERENQALKKGSKHNPFNNVKFRNLSKDKKPMKFRTLQGVTKSEIPPGDEHLYILKSEVVPPVCPKCPDCPKPKCNNGGKGSCPPCPRPERCPEPAFTCKKVPNYSVSSVDGALPSPMFMSGAGGGAGGMSPIVLNYLLSFHKIIFNLNYYFITFLNISYLFLMSFVYYFGTILIKHFDFFPYNGSVQPFSFSIFLILIFLFPFFNINCTS